MWEEARTAAEERGEECRRVREALEESEREKREVGSKLKEAGGRCKFLTEQNAELQAEIALISAKVTAQLKRLRELETANAALHRHLSEAAGEGAEESRREAEEARRRAEEARAELASRDREVKLL